MHEEFAERGHERDGAVEIGIAVFLVSADADEFLGSLVSCEKAADSIGFCEMLGGDDVGHDAADAVED